MAIPVEIEERSEVIVARASASCSVKITRKSADGEFVSVESMNSMTTGDLEMSPLDTERLLYRLTENLARKCYVDLHVHEAITSRELAAAIERVREQYRALGTPPKDPSA